VGKKAENGRMMECGHAVCHLCAWNQFNAEVGPYWKIDIIVRDPENGIWKVRAFATDHLDYSAHLLNVNKDRYLYAQSDLIGIAIETLTRRCSAALLELSERDN
jgi:hypothetical protein